MNARHPSAGQNGWRLGVSLGCLVALVGLLAACSPQRSEKEPFSRAEPPDRAQACAKLLDDIGHSQASPTSSEARRAALDDLAVVLDADAQLFELAGDRDMASSVLTVAKGLASESPDVELSVFLGDQATRSDTVKAG